MIAFLAAIQNQTEDIRDIHEMVVAGIPRWIWVLAAVCCLLVAAYCWWRKRQTKIVPDSDETLALRGLEEARSMIKPGAAREFCAVVSNIIRIYIGKRYQIPVVRETTEELVRRHLADADSPLSLHAAALREFLDLCDLAKFAKGELAEEDMGRVLEQARLLVEAMRPVTAVATPKKGGTP